MSDLSLRSADRQQTFKHFDRIFDDVMFGCAVQKSPYVDAGEWNENNRRSFSVESRRAIRNVKFENLWRNPRCNVINTPFLAPFHRLQSVIHNEVKVMQRTMEGFFTSRSIFSALSGFQVRARSHRNKKWSSCSGFKISWTERRN